MDQVFTEADLLLSIQNRAQTYYYILRAFWDKYGANAKEVFAQAIYDRGFAESQDFPIEAKSSLKALAEVFCFETPDAGLSQIELVEASDNLCVVHLHRCPLIETWRSMNLDHRMIEHLCDVADPVDIGIANGLGYDCVLTKRIVEGDTYCELKFTLVAADRNN